jgi:hypothetical protein
MPWGVTEGIPVIGSLLTVRWMLVIYLFVGLLVGLAFEHFPRSGQRRYVATALIGLTFLTLIPVRLADVRGVRTPAFFTSAGRDLRGTVLLVPVPNSADPTSMAWHAMADVRFAIPGGYFVGPGPGRHAIYGVYPRRKLDQALIQIVSLGGTIDVSPTLRSLATKDLIYWGVQTVVLGPTKHRAECLAFLTDLLRRPPEETGGVAIWRDVDPRRI